MKKLIIAALALPMLFACDENNVEPVIPEYEAPYQMYVVNEGSWQKNNASISAFNTLTPDSNGNDDIYFLRNEQQLGDVAQDMVYNPVNHCLYVSVSESRYIAKLNAYGKELARYSTTEEQAQPRSLALIDGYLYATLFGGMVAKLDTAMLALQATVKVGTYPEQLASANGVIAVCNSGYSAENTVSIIDLASFGVKETVVLPHYNPQHIVALGNNFYCNTTEYDASWNAVSNIVEIAPSANTWTASDITEGFYMMPANGKLYIVKQETNYYTTPYSYINEFKVFDPATRAVDQAFATGNLATILADKAIYGLSYCPQNGDIYFCISQQEGYEYVNSTVMAYDVNGNLHNNKLTGILSKKVVFAE